MTRCVRTEKRVSVKKAGKDTDIASIINKNQYELMLLQSFSLIWLVYITSF